VPGAVAGEASAVPPALAESAAALVFEHAPNVMLATMASAIPSEGAKRHACRRTGVG
jgi:hypothetical protein